MIGDEFKLKRDLELRKSLHEKSEEKRKDKMVGKDFFKHKSNKIQVFCSLMQELNNSHSKDEADDLKAAIMEV